MPSISYMTAHNKSMGNIESTVSVKPFELDRITKMCHNISRLPFLLNVNAKKHKTPLIHIYLRFTLQTLNSVLRKKRMSSSWGKGKSKVHWATVCWPSVCISLPSFICPSSRLNSSLIQMCKTSLINLLKPGNKTQLEISAEHAAAVSVCIADAESSKLSALWRKKWANHISAENEVASSCWCDICFGFLSEKVY